jgi:hypothetical protein
MVQHARQYDFENQMGINTSIVVLASIQAGVAILHIFIPILAYLSLYQFSKKTQLLWTTLTLVGLVVWGIIQVAMQVACCVLCSLSIIIQVVEIGIAAGYGIYTGLTLLIYIPLICVGIYRIRTIRNLKEENEIANA